MARGEKHLIKKQDMINVARIELHKLGPGTRVSYQNLREWLGKATFYPNDTLLSEIVERLITEEDLVRTTERSLAIPGAPPTEHERSKAKLADLQKQVELLTQAVIQLQHNSTIRSPIQVAPAPSTKEN